jgi:putative phosphoesterase
MTERILVVSDVHANFEALRALPDTFEHVLCLGDLVDYGPDPKSCLDWLRDRDAIVVRGNHDEAVASRESCRCNMSMRAESEATRQVMWRVLRPLERDYLGTLPIQADVLLGGLRFHLVHATPSDPLYTYVRPDDRKRWEEEMAKIDADILLVGHTHLPMILRFGKKLIVNPGSVGQPRDGDPRASYAVIEDGEPRLERVAYDIEATIRALQGRELPPAIFDRLARILRTGSVTGG